MLSLLEVSLLHKPEDLHIDVFQEEAERVTDKTCQLIEGLEADFVNALHKADKFLGPDEVLY